MKLTFNSQTRTITVAFDVQGAPVVEAEHGLDKIDATSLFITLFKLYQQPWEVDKVLIEGPRLLADQSYGLPLSREWQMIEKDWGKHVVPEWVREAADQACAKLNNEVNAS